MFSLTCANCGRQTDEADHDHGCPEIDRSIKRVAKAMERHTVYALQPKRHVFDGERGPHTDCVEEIMTQANAASLQVEQIASFVEHLRDGYQSTTEPVSKVARLIRERFGDCAAVEATLAAKANRSKG